MQYLTQTTFGMLFAVWYFESCTRHPSRYSFVLWRTARLRYGRYVTLSALSPTPRVTLVSPFRPATTGYVLLGASERDGV